ncbi:IclR family transcriptional regulator C-terminal domain-containing protein [Klugiella xanthotipulae]|uniref:IclR family transcriptional regulator n=1 Tax=Klugiella xanthotipulae TaxID=244735 RepID=A0A543HT82_9MICO|nr:IclR family transcriptional regulator C-terminal domain-containing protein [Klugiella xanthotipulae]TQM61555.1 IclR family transcriptional regulator [Klugiella xanthotipulae]
MTQSAPPATEQFVQSLARGLAVIRAFDANHPAMTLSEVAKRTDLNRAAARRFLLTLVELGYMRTDGRMFELTPLVLQLGYSFLSGQSLPRIAQPLLEDLSASMHESVSMAVLDGSDIVYVARIHTKRIMSIGISVGTRFPASVTSMGRVLLAGLGEDELNAFLGRVELTALTERTLTDPAALHAEIVRVREQGWAMVDQELELGLRSVAVPVYDPQGRVVAALNVSMQASLHSTDDITETIVTMVTGLQEVAEKIREVQRAMS